MTDSKPTPRSPSRERVTLVATTMLSLVRDETAMLSISHRGITGGNSGGPAQAALAASPHRLS